MTDKPNDSNDLAADDPSDDSSRLRWPALVLAAVALLVLLDVVTDAGTGVGLTHLALEAMTIAIAGAGAITFWRRAEVRRRKLGRLERDLVATRAELERWRAEAHEALLGLGAAIDRQCDRWQLSTAEREVALLLLKGLSFKEVADARQTSERTVRQQALAVYRKAGLSGRAELAAFFLEDLLLPSGKAPAAPQGT
jgi:DNA-binding CsgD family transcriptional regulator